MASAASIFLQLVEIVGQVGKRILESLPLPGLHDDRVGLGADIQRISGHGLPVVEDALGEGLTAGIGAEIGGEAWRRKNKLLNKGINN